MNYLLFDFVQLTSKVDSASFGIRVKQFFTIFNNFFFVSAALGEKKQSRKFREFFSVIVNFSLQIYPKRGGVSKMQNINIKGKAQLICASRLQVVGKDEQKKVSIFTQETILPTYFLTYFSLCQLKHNTCNSFLSLKVVIPIYLFSMTL